MSPILSTLIHHPFLVVLSPAEGAALLLRELLKGSETGQVEHMGAREKHLQAINTIKYKYHFYLNYAVLLFELTVIGYQGIGGEGMQLQMA